LKCGAKLPGKRIDDPDARAGLAVVEVFGMDGVAKGFEGGGEDRGVWLDLVSSWNPEIPFVMALRPSAASATLR
jgi:hypothetical protein